MKRMRNARMQNARMQNVTMRNASTLTVIVFAAAVSAVAAHAQDVRINTAGGVKTFVTTMPVETTALKGAPYAAEVVTDSTQALADGNRIVQRSSGRVYRDGQGRVRREEDRPSGDPSITIVDPIAGVSYSLDPDTHVAWKTPSPAGEEIVKKLEAAMKEVIKVKRREPGAAQPTPPDSGVMQRRSEEEARKVEAEVMAEKMAGGRVGYGYHYTYTYRPGSAEEQRSQEQLPERVMEGVQVQGHRTTTTIAAGAIGNELPLTIVFEEWVSPELQVLVMTQRKDPRNGDSSYRLLNVVRGEPSASLFQVPVDYTVKATGIRKFDFSRHEQ